MKKLILTATGCLCLAGSAYFLNSVVGQDKAARKEAAAEELPHKIALIDMAYVFKNYDKTKYQEEDWKALAQEEENKLKAKFKRGQDMELELKDFKPDSPEFDARRQKIDKLAQDLQFEKKQAQTRLQREKAKNDLTIYHEVHDAVEKFCRHFNYSLVIQFNRSEANSTDPNRMMQIVNQPVVYYRKAENGKSKDDLSEPVVKWLNEKYAKDSGGEGNVASDKPTSDKPAPKKDKNIKPAEGTVAPSGTKRVKNAD